MRALTCICFFFAFISADSFGQDIQFSQFYAAPTHLNPAYAGNTPGTRVASIFRSQWTSLVGTFNSFNLSLDRNFSDRNSGIGLNFTRDKAGSVDLNFTKIELNYAYYIKINRQLKARLGLGGAFASRSADVSKFVFSSQIAQNTTTIPQGYSFQTSRYFDLSTGGLLYGSNWWAGLSFGHLNMPQQNIVATAIAGNSLPILMSLHGGYTFKLKESIKKKAEFTMTPILHYKSSRKWDQLDIGSYFNKRILTFGAWYRGLPLIKRNPEKNPSTGFNQSLNQDAVILLFGLEVDEMRLAYSYDITVSKLSTGSSGGSHEITFIWEIASRQQKLSYRKHLVPCAKF